MTAKLEREIMRDIELALAGTPGLRLWRCNVGQGWTGEVEQVSGGNDGRTVLIRKARPFNTGLPEGHPDLYGWLNANGSTLPVYIEVKSERGPVRAKQSLFIRAAQRSGCLAGIARSIDDARRILAGEWIECE